MYYLLLVTTAVRSADIIYILLKDSTNLPTAVIVATLIMVMYGIFIGVKRLVASLRLKELLHFYIFQTLVIVFNLIFVAVTSPLQMSMTETLIIGTFLDLLINAVIIYGCTKQIRSFNMPVQHAAGGQSMNA